MRTILAAAVTDAVRELCIHANCVLPEDVLACIQKARAAELSPVGRNILEKLEENADVARQKHMPICQDTGMAVFFVELGQDVHVEGGSLTEAINEGVRLGYRDGFLRKSVESDPLQRVNTGDNTPAVIHYDLVPGDALKLTFAPKGFGSENMSALKMLKPADGLEGVISFVLDTVRAAGPNPCPPIVVGLGLGGTMEKCALLAKKALTRPLDSANPNPFYADLEHSLLGQINALGIGPQGFGGKTTALKVNIETFPTHIAGLPVAVNINCHVTRHESITL